MRRPKVPLAFAIVGSMFLVIGIGFACGVIVLLNKQTGPSTWLPAMVACGWVTLAMTGSMALAVVGGRVVSRKASGRRGVIAVQTRWQGDNQQVPTAITGPGAEVEGSADVEVHSRLPAVFLALSAAGLAVVTAYFYVIGRATLLGAGIGLLVAFYNANWARQARPRSERSRVLNGEQEGAQSDGGDQQG
jgi:hypothetical protein